MAYFYPLRRRFRAQCALRPRFVGEMFSDPGRGFLPCDRRVVAALLGRVVSFYPLWSCRVECAPPSPVKPAELSARCRRPGLNPVILFFFFFPSSLFGIRMAAGREAGPRVEGTRSEDASSFGSYRESRWPGSMPSPWRWCKWAARAFFFFAAYDRE